MTVEFVVLIVAAAQAFLLALLIYQKHRSLYANRFLSLMMLAGGIAVLGDEYAMKAIAFRRKLAIVPGVNLVGQVLGCCLRPLGSTPLHGNEFMRIAWLVVLATSKRLPGSLFRGS